MIRPSSSCVDGHQLNSHRKLDFFEVLCSWKLEYGSFNSAPFLSQATSTTHKAVFTTVSITVKDMNDNPPTFLDTPYTGAVLENASLGMTIMRVTAVDIDEVTSQTVV